MVEALPRPAPPIPCGSKQHGAATATDAPPNELEAAGEDRGDATRPEFRRVESLARSGEDGALLLALAPAALLLLILGGGSLIWSRRDRS